MDGQVDEAVKAQRVHRLIALGEKLSRRYREGFLGQVAQVLLEEALPDDGGAEGYTPNTSTYVHRMAGPARWRWCGLRRLPKKEWRVRL